MRMRFKDRHPQTIVRWSGRFRGGASRFFAKARACQRDRHNGQKPKTEAQTRKSDQIILPWSLERTECPIDSLENGGMRLEINTQYFADARQKPADFKELPAAGRGDLWTLE